MMLRGYCRVTRAIVAASAFLLLLAAAYPAAADSFASLQAWGFPTTASGLDGVSDTSSNSGGLSASVSSISPVSGFTGFFGTGADGTTTTTAFTWPVASHDASALGYSRDVAFEKTLGNDAVSFPDIKVDTSSALSNFPTIDSATSDTKYMESTQLQLATESDTFPITTGICFPSFSTGWW